MLDISTAKVVKAALDDYFSYNAISLESVCRMNVIPLNNGVGLTILSLQYAELTILVRIQITQSGVKVVEIKTQDW